MARSPGGPEYGPLLAAARRLLDAVACVDAPDEVTARAWVESVEVRKIVVRGDLRNGEDMLSEAHGLFITPGPVRALPS